MFFSRTATLIAPAAGAVAIGAAVLATAGPANAHFGVDANSTAAGGYSVLTFSTGHGCDGSPTTKVAISIPESITSVTPTRHPLWNVETKTEKLDEPITDAHGNSITERDATVIYTAKEPLVDGERETFEISLKLPEQAGEELAFPTIQTCAKGENAWTQVAADGQDADALESPAPVLTLSEATGDGHGHGASAADGAGHGEKSDEAKSDDGNDLHWTSIAGLIAGLVGAVAGLIALARSSRRNA